MTTATSQPVSRRASRTRSPKSTKRPVSASTSTVQPRETSSLHISPPYREDVEAMIESPIINTRLPSTRSATTAPPANVSPSAESTDSNQRSRAGPVGGSLVAGDVVSGGVVSAPAGTWTERAMAAPRATATTGGNRRIRLIAGGRTATLPASARPLPAARSAAGAQLVADLGEDVEFRRPVLGRLDDVAVVRLDDEEEDERNDEEDDDRLNDEAEADVRVADVEADIDEVLLAEDRGDDGHDDAIDEGVDDHLEVQRHHQADGDHDDVAFVDEFLVLGEHPLQHRAIRPSCLGSAAAGAAAL